MKTKFVVLSIKAFALLSLLTACDSGFAPSSQFLQSLRTSSLTAPGATSSPPGSTTPQTGRDCGDPRLPDAFDQSFRPFVRTNCILCHGAGVTGRAFASSNLAEAFDSWQDHTNRDFKENKAIANALNPNHGTPSTNGPFNKAAIDAAKAKFESLLTQYCSNVAAPTPAPTPMAGGTPTPGGSATPGGTTTTGGQWVFCANENGTCAFSGVATVQFGYSPNWKTLILTNGTPCTNAIFGDPAPGYQKSCFYMQGGTAPTQPSTMPTPISQPPASATPPPANMPTVGTGTGTRIGLLTQQSLVPTFKAMLGVAPSQATIAALYNDNVNSNYRASRRFMLPTRPDPSAMNSASMMIITVSAPEHCRDLVEQEQNSGTYNFFQGINIGAGSFSLSSSQASALATAFAKRFWNRSPTADETSAFQTVASELSGQGITMKQGLIVICSGALSSVSSVIK